MSIPLKYGSSSGNPPGMKSSIYCYFCLVLAVCIAKSLLKHRNLMPLEILNLKMRPPCQTNYIICFLMKFSLGVL